MNKLDEIKERFSKTTEGPWKIGEAGSERKYEFYGEVDTTFCEDDCILTDDDMEMLGTSEWIRVRDEDLEFLAHSWGISGG